MLDHAERFLSVAQSEVKMGEALGAAAKYAFTAYDTQYIALAQDLNVLLITEGRKLRDAVPGIAFSIQEFLSH